MTIMIELTKKTIEDIAIVIDERMEKRIKRDERLYKLKEISAMVNISERTLRNMHLPFRRIGPNTRKMYSLNEVKDYLKR
jgi:hypothetical protein